MHDDVDLSGLRWSRGGYERAALGKASTRRSMAERFNAVGIPAAAVSANSSAG